MAFKFNRSRNEPMSEINVTPFVDVKLVLLIIFMVHLILLLRGHERNTFKNDKLKVISFFAKKARGSFARFIIEDKPKKIEDLTSFSGLGYQFSEINSKNEIIFTR